MVLTSEQKSFLYNAKYKCIGIKPVIDQNGLSQDTFEIVLLFSDLQHVLPIVKKLDKETINYLNKLIKPEDFI